MSAAELPDLQQRLEAHLRQVAQPRDPDWSPLGHQQVERYIQEQLSGWGSLESFPFEAGGRLHRNWILKLPGSRSGRPPILIGAHFDAAPATPGADDNASGIAVLLELARHFAANPSSSEPTSTPLRQLLEQTTTPAAWRCCWSWPAILLPSRLLLRCGWWPSTWKSGG